MANRFNRFHHAKRVSVRGVDCEHVHFCFGQFHGALQEIPRCAHCRAHAQAPMLVFGSAGVFQFLLNVLYGDQALQIKVLIHHEQFFDAVLLQDTFGLF